MDRRLDAEPRGQARRAAADRARLEVGRAIRRRREHVRAGRKLEAECGRGGHAPLTMARQEREGLLIESDPAVHLDAQRSARQLLDLTPLTSLPSRRAAGMDAERSTQRSVSAGERRPLDLAPPDRVVLSAALDATASRPRVARRPGRRVVARREVEGTPQPVRRFPAPCAPQPGLPETCNRPARACTLLHAVVDRGS